MKNYFLRVAAWYSTRSNWVRYPLDTILFAIAIFLIAAPLFRFDAATSMGPTLDALMFAGCLAPVFSFTATCLRDFPR